MTYRLKLTSLIAGAVVAVTSGLVGASAGGFDLSPEQPNPETRRQVIFPKTIKT
jgi:hypothetical protein